MIFGLLQCLITSELIKPPSLTLDLIQFFCGFIFPRKVAIMSHTASKNPHIIILITISLQSNSFTTHPVLTQSSWKKMPIVASKFIRKSEESYNRFYVLSFYKHNIGLSVGSVQCTAMSAKYNLQTVQWLIHISNLRLKTRERKLVFKRKWHKNLSFYLKKS
jgi:hypothetical protein